MAKKITFEFRQLLFDVVALSVSFFLVVWIAPLNAVDPFTKYGYIYLPYSIAWIIVAMLHGRYKKRLKDQSYGKAMGVAFNTTLIT
ncbi:MAG: hypothetical protein SPK61_03740, partial [Bacteroidales bacterium]|nr:hypothetical protein [Bacteroidales bacterium]MDY6427110.1 hypothetical protein [Bacteroidales bacterium]